MVKLSPNHTHSKMTPQCIFPYFSGETAFRTILPPEAFAYGSKKGKPKKLGV